MVAITRRGALAGMVLACPALAQSTWPARPITIIVAYAPGGTGDMFARATAERLRVALGQNVVVENRSGASGAIGTQAVVRAAPDGYTLLLGQTPEIAIAKSFVPNVAYDSERDLAPIVMIGDAALALVVPAARPYRNVADLVAAARAGGRGVTFASSGTGTPGHFAAEVLALRAKEASPLRGGGGGMTHVPYRGAGPALADLLGGHVDFFFSGMPAAVPHVREGTLRMLAVSTARRRPGVPDVPTVQEGGVPDFDFSLWSGLFAPAGTPPEVIARVNREVNAIIAEPAIRNRFVQEGAEILANSPEDFAAIVRRDIAKYAAVIQATGVRPE